MFHLSEESMNKAYSEIRLIEFTGKIYMILVYQILHQAKS